MCLAPFSDKQKQYYSKPRVLPGIYMDHLRQISTYALFLRHCTGFTLLALVSVVQAGCADWSFWFGICPAPYSTVNGQRCKK